MPLVWTWIEGAEAIAALQPEWHTLALRDPQAGVFQLPAVALGLAGAGAYPDAPLIGTARDHAGALVAVLPLSRGQQLVGRVPVTLIRRLGVGSVDRLDLISDLSHESAISAAVCHGLARLRRRGAMLDIMPVREGSRLYRALHSDPQGKAQKSTREFAVHHEVTLAGAAAWGELTNRSVRSNVSRGERAIQRIGGEYRCHRSADDVPRWMAQFRQIHRARQRSLGRPSILDGDQNFAAFDSCLTQLVADGTARLHALHVGSEMIAGHITLHWRNTATSYRIAFDEAHALVSPGLVLLSHVIDDAIKSGAQRFDFGYGNEMYKSRWTRETTPVHRFGVAPASARYYLGRITRKVGWFMTGRARREALTSAD